MGKRANNEGSVYQRADGRWCAAYQVNGKRKYVYGQTQSDALAKLRAVQAAMANDTYSEPNRMTVGGWLSFWLAQIAPVGLRASTLNTNRIIIEKTLLPALGDVKLQDKRLADRIQRFINDRSAQGIAPATIRRETAVLTRALNAALDRQYINRMPKLVFPKQEQKEIQFLTREEIPRLLAALPETTQGRALRFILGAGLRAEELCGLRWQDIDEQGMHITQTVQLIRGAYVVQPPKSKSSRRTVPLNDGLRALLEAQRRAQRLERLAAGSAWQAGDYVFATATGAPADRYNLNRALYAALDRAGLKHRSVHALRHTFATLWVQSGQDIRTLSEVIGHSSVAFTMQKYVHSDSTTKRQGMELMASFL